MEEIRLLSKEDIDVRVAQTTSYTNNGTQVVKVNLLLYKDARVDMKILDELYTPMGWKRSHKLIGDRLYCQVEVWDKEKKEWILKEDVGVESNTEAEKGQASDSFKRACVNWGIGRELYTAPKVAVELNEREYTKGQDGRIKVWASFEVSQIGYNEKTRTITSLTIVDRFGNVRFSMGETSAPAEEKPATKSRKKKETPAPVAEPAPVSNYRPCDLETYYKFIEAEANGIKCKSGKTSKERWIEMTCADKDAILLFDKEVMDYRANII